MSSLVFYGFWISKESSLTSVILLCENEVNTCRFLAITQLMYRFMLSSLLDALLSFPSCGTASPGSVSAHWAATKTVSEAADSPGTADASQQEMTMERFGCVYKTFIVFLTFPFLSISSWSRNLGSLGLFCCCLNAKQVKRRYVLELWGEWGCGMALRYWHKK